MEFKEIVELLLDKSSLKPLDIQYDEDTVVLTISKNSSYYEVEDFTDNFGAYGCGWNGDLRTLEFNKLDLEFD